MEGLLGPRLLHGNGEVATSSIAAAGTVALYFSAHWCGPCKEYTPELAKVYKRAKAKGKSLEVVFVSRDRDLASFKDYFGTMPWCAIPFEDQARKEALCSTFQVRGIPSLVLLSGTGNVLDPNARSKVMLPSFLSTLPRTIDLVDVGPLPTDTVKVLVRHRGEEHELDVEPEEGWEILRVKIFSVTEVPEEQQRLFGLGVVRGPLDDSLPLDRALAGGLRAQSGSGLRLANIPESSRSASSAFKNDELGSGFHRGCLDSPCAWIPLAEDKASWYQLDLGAPASVAGVALAPRADRGHWVERFRVSCAQAEAGPWTAVEGGREFEGCETFPQEPVRLVFAMPVTARFVRILPTSFHEHAALRADVLLQDGAAPDAPPSIVVLGNASADDPFEPKGGGGAGAGAAPGSPQQMVEEQHLAMLQARTSSLPQRLQHEVNSVKGACRYEDRALQRQALDDIPICALDRWAIAAMAAPKDPEKGAEQYEVAFMRKVLQWFKHGFFEWTNSPRCEHCGSKDTKSVGRAQPTPIEKQFAASVVEVAQCSACGMQTRFPRYNDPGKLLESRQGRCGEWANCFTLVCRALGFESRLVHDWTDHVWTEAYFDCLGRWVHMDSCEAALDTPLVYEKGWGKKLTYCLAYARDHAVDVTRRYSRKYPEVLTRRTQFSEQELKRAMVALSDFAMDRALGELQGDMQAKRRKALEGRLEAERKQLEECEALSEEAAKAEEKVGRTSGDAEWRAQRGELGADAGARSAALMLSEEGLAGLAGPGAAVLKSKFSELQKSGMAAPEAAAAALEATQRRQAAAATAKVERVTNIHDDRSEDSWTPLKTIGPFEDDLQFLAASVRWRDQGFGNSKGRIRAVLRRGDQSLGEIDCFGLAPRHAGGFRRELTDIGGTKPVKGDSLAFEYVVGGGGGHQLHLDAFEVAYSTSKAEPSGSASASDAARAKYQEHVAKGLSPEEAAAALLSSASASAASTSCASAAPAEEAKSAATPAAGAPAGRKVDVQAYLKQRFAEHIAAGLDPTAAAAKMLEEAKRLQEEKTEA